MSLYYSHACINTVRDDVTHICNHRIVECFVLEGTFKEFLVLTICLGQRCLNLDLVAQSPLNPALNISTNGQSTASLDNLFQCITILMLKTPFICLQSKPLFFQFKTIAPCSTTADLFFHLSFRLPLYAERTQYGAPTVFSMLKKQQL